MPSLEKLEAMCIPPREKKPLSKQERKAQAKAIIQEDVKKLFLKLQHDLHLTPDDITKLVHQSMTQERQKEPATR